MSRGEPAVLLMPPAGAPDVAPGLTAALVSEAQRWANEVAPRRVQRAGEPLTDEIARVLEAHHGPLLVVWPVLAQLREEHASGALGDLDDGADLVIGPVIDGGLYLLGLSRPLAELGQVPDHTWSSAEAMPAALGGAAKAGLEVGILRAERALRKPADVRAALADPLTPPPIAALLEGGRK